METITLHFYMLKEKKPMEDEPVIILDESILGYPGSPIFRYVKLVNEGNTWESTFESGPASAWRCSANDKWAYYNRENDLNELKDRIKVIEKKWA